jgi:hypothetical protein
VQQLIPAHALSCLHALQHMLPNFNECWWDSWLLDVAICNSLGEAPVQMFGICAIFTDSQRANEPASQCWYSQPVTTLCCDVILQ